MDKNSIKKYAVWARRELISRVNQKALQYGVSEKESIDAAADMVNGHLISGNEKKQRQALVNRIKQIGYQQTMEEAAYTWFNRFSALRFMEVNGYLPTHVRVFTDEQNAFKPQILAEAIHMELDGLSMDKVYELKDANKTDELYKYLLITQCNALSAVLPGMFTRIEDYTELLFPDNLLREGSIIEQMISMIPEEDWKDAVQIIGWLYQYYNVEPKDKVFADLKKNIKISKENIPAATQLFTPDWIVRYMVENSLGRLWVEGHPNEDLKTNWKYYLEEAEQEPDVQAQLAEIHKEYAAIRPEDIKVIDPCMGSGHILVYLFEVLIQIYESYGYNTRDAAGLILKNNLYGLDIDDRAAQLAYFAVMMKARQYDRRFFSRKDEDGNPKVLQPHVYAIVESNHVDQFAVEYFCNGDAKLKEAMDTIISELHDAKEYGSILTVTQQDWSALYARFAEVTEDINMSRETALRELLPLVKCAEVLAQKYDVVVTNPPYMGASGMGAKLSEFVKKKFPDSKADLFAVFIERCGQMAKKNGYQAMITQHAWMFLSSFEKLRTKMLAVDIVNMAHLSANAFEDIQGDFVQTVAFVLQKKSIKDFCGTYCRLVEPDTQEGKERLFLSGNNRFFSKQNLFTMLPTTPIAYWASHRLCTAFQNQSLREYGTVKSGMQTGNNELFLRFWYEVPFVKIGLNATDYVAFSKLHFKWAPQTKGGLYRKWYGNYEYVVNFENDCYSIRHYPGTVRTRDLAQYFSEGITWTHTTAGSFSARLLPNGFTFNVESPSLFLNGEMVQYYLGLLNSKVSQECLTLLNSAFHYHAEDVLNIPTIKSNEHEITQKVNDNISLSRLTWDSFETSWDFKRNPLI